MQIAAAAFTTDAMIIIKGMPHVRYYRPNISKIYFHIYRITMDYQSQRSHRLFVNTANPNSNRSQSPPRSGIRSDVRSAHRWLWNMILLLWINAQCPTFPNYHPVLTFKWPSSNVLHLVGVDDYQIIYLFIYVFSNQSRINVICFLSAFDCRAQP